MTNEKLGVLMVDVPEPKYWKYSYIESSGNDNSFCVENVDSASWVSISAYRCTKEEAKKHPQFRWVSLEEL